MHSGRNLIDHLHALHSDELAQLPATPNGGRQPNFYSMLYQYLRYLRQTWGNILKSVVSLRLNPVDFALALGCSVILGVALFLCIFLKLPFVQHTFNVWSRKSAYGLSVANALSNIFRDITQTQVDAAKAALAQPPIEAKTKGERAFNVDIAKLLLQLSALMYERGTEPIIDALSVKKAHPMIDEKKQDSKGSSGSDTLQSFVPQQEGDLSPTSLLADIMGPPVAEEIDERLNRNPSDGAIRDFCRTFGIDYSPVSELNRSDSAYTALFWDPHANWIVVAFKGTSPSEYTEWVSDFTYGLVDAGDWLPGFSQGGFLQRIFPSDVAITGGIRPWDTITGGIKLIAEHLHKEGQDPSAKINVYFTGHSLGCAMASLAYARAVLVEKDLGEHVVLRDGYIFAAPIVCDVPSVKAFNGAVNTNYDMPKTLWRVTNMKDVVATALPAYGDKEDSLFPKDSLLNFAHLGAELKMRSKPTTSMVAGWPHITRGLPVFVTSSLPADLVGTLGIHQGMAPSVLGLERLPLIGRFFQHSTSFYWDQLQRMGVGQCDWVRDD